MSGRYWMSCLFLLVACGSPDWAPAPKVVLTPESGEPLSHVPAIDRYTLIGLLDVALGDIWLVEGDVSAASQKRLRTFDVPDTVEKARLPMAVWREEGTAGILLMPSIPLEARGRYSVVALGVGLIATLDVADENRGRLWRWGQGSISPGQQVSYCRVPPPDFVEPVPVVPVGSLPALENGFASLEDPQLGDLCVRIRVPDGTESFFVPPPRLGEFLVEPTPIPLGGDDESPPSVPDRADCPFAPQPDLRESACVRSVAGGVELILPAGDYAIRISPAEAGEKTYARSLHRASGDKSYFVGPIPPDVELSLHWESLDSASAPPVSTVLLRSAPAAPRFVLTEVMANPIGAEPQAEWVEVLNAGNAPGSLLGLEIADEIGAVPLPDTVLGPGEYGLIVRADFMWGGDVAPDPAAIPIWVAGIGGNGLRNSGEVLELRRFDQVVSRLVPGDVPEGVSWARLSPWGLDGEESFARHGVPGCSPGRENVFEEN